jgi:hypothetical protein
MARMLATLQTGDWLTLERIRLIAGAALLAALAGLCYLIATSDGLNDHAGRPLGTDFSNIYAAGQLVLEERPAAPYDPVQHRERERAIFGETTPFYGWLYPPFFLLVAAALALMPYAMALAAWQAVGLVLYLLSIKAILRAQPASSLPTGSEHAASERLWLLLALAFPAVFVNIGHGHNGFLTAALLSGGLALLDQRPWIAGILLGLLAYKPQFALMIPLALAVSGRWRPMLSAAATVGALTLATLLALGPETWRAFFGSLQFTRVIVLEQGGPGWYKVQSVFSAVRMWGGAVPLAYALQLVTTLALAAGLAWLWRSQAAFAVRAAALAIAAILATPYNLDYDMMAFAPAIAFLVANGLARGFAPYEKTMLAALWLLPLIARTVTQITLIPVGPIVMGAAFALLLRKARRKCNAALPWISTRMAA